MPTNYIDGTLNHTDIPHIFLYFVKLQATFELEGEQEETGYSIEHLIRKID